MSEEQKMNKVTVQGLITPVPAASVGGIASHVSSLSSDCDPAVMGVAALAPTAASATSAESIDKTFLATDPAMIMDSVYDSVKCGGGSPARTGCQVADKMGSGLDLTLEAINDNLLVQSRELISLLEEEGSVRLSQESVPVDMLDNLALTDDELDITMIPASSGSSRLPSVVAGNSECLSLGVPSTSKGCTPVPAVQPLTRQDATEVGESEEGRSKDKSLSSSSPSKVRDTAREVKDRSYYKKAVSYLRKFVDKDPGSYTEREVVLVKNNMKFVRKFERIYPHVTKRELLIERIVLPVISAVKVKASSDANTEPTIVSPPVDLEAMTGPIDPKGSKGSTPKTISTGKDVTCPVGRRVERLSASAKKTKTASVPSGRAEKASANVKGVTGGSLPKSQKEKLAGSKKSNPSTTLMSSSGARPYGSGNGTKKVPRPAVVVSAAASRLGSGTESCVPVLGSKNSAPHTSARSGRSSHCGKVEEMSGKCSDGPSTSKGAMRLSKAGSDSRPSAVKRVRSTEDPQPAAKKSLTGRRVSPTLSFAAALGKVNTGDKAMPVPTDDFRVAIIDNADPEGKISDSRWLLVEGRLRGIIISGTSGQSNRLFGGAFLHKGVKVVNCYNKESADFLIGAVNDLGDLWEGARLAAVPFAEIPSRRAVTAWVPPPAVELADILTLLERQNPDLRTGGWRIVHSAPCTENGGLIIRVILDKEGATYLAERKGKLNFGLGWIRFRLKPDQ